MIDDDQTFCQMVTDILATTPCQVTATTDYREGLRLAMTHPPDLILLDIHMPEVSGLDLIKQFRNMQSTRHVPVMMVTGDDRVDSVATARQFNAVGYILKPFKPLYLIERIGQLMGVELMSGLQQANLQPQSGPKAASLGESKTIRVKTKTLLVIDDEPVIFQLINDILEDSILKVETAPSAREGLRTAMTAHVDVILIDANMPEITGLQAIEQLRHMRTTHGVPIILMSGQPLESLAAQLAEAEITAFLAKPFTPGELIQHLQKALGKEIFWT
ncbi:MAG: hypothetical protein CVV27_00360 [Candidatus Melainabacteria bacterium HGW-Melainabacteria-1]|nr:MAG: hypothetical protein CVV27_00360 [Candidatus Melainabacteria bacterium HGW-Melainabacteria-1]